MKPRYNEGERKEDRLSNKAQQATETREGFNNNDSTIS